MSAARTADDRSGAGLSCFHCGLPVESPGRFTALIGDTAREMCCPGCVAVAELIAAGGLGDYYRYRTVPAANPEEVTADLEGRLTVYDRPQLQKAFAREDGPLRRVNLTVDGLRCAACVWLIETRLAACEGVAEVAVTLGNERAEVAWDPELTTLSGVLGEIAQLGYGARPYRSDEEADRRTAESRSALFRVGVAGLAMMQVMMFTAGLYAGAFQGMDDVYRDLLRWVSAVVTTPVVLFSARPFFVAAWRDLTNGSLGMDVPVAIAVASAYGAGLVATWLGQGEVYFESVCMFVFFLVLGRFLEMRARHRGAESVESTLRRVPESAVRLLPDGGTEIVGAIELCVGDRVLVRPGQSVPADGSVTDGRGAVDEAMLTGEQWPVTKGPGDSVLGGTQNGEAPLTVAVERTGADTVLAGILALVDRAGRSKPRIAATADRVAAVFVPSVLLLAAVTAIAWYRIDSARAFWVTLSVLVVSCPCALSLATPAALTAGAGATLRRGLLATRAHVLESLAGATHVVFDKTGTLTAGRFRIAETVTAGDLDAERCRAIARALEHSSEHPIARAFEGGEQDEGRRDAATDVEVTTGLGVEGVIDGRRYRIGKPEWAAECARRAEAGEQASASGLDTSTSVLLGGEDGPLAWFRLEDAPRPDAVGAVARLRSLGLHVGVVSGDAPAAVEAVARSLGIETAIAAAKPEDKLRRVRALQSEGARVVMVGDGMNDAPGLGGADVSIAMGGGTALAKTHADAVLLRDDLDAIADAIVVARRTRSVIRQNLAWAAAYNALALPLAAAGRLAPYEAALGMSVSSLVVVLNALRLGRRSAVVGPRVQVAV